ncbi:MAG: PH domain-containing protein [Firmicutes bacterium]|nr:PH domain-containing protein [Bacillota bacterium]
MALFGKKKETAVEPVVTPQPKNYDLRTGAGMYHYAADHGYGSGENEKWGIKHFDIVAQQLLPDETVDLTFIGLHNYVSATKHDQNYAYAVTNKRLVFAQKKTLSGETIKTVSLDRINDITFQSGMLFGVITVDTPQEKFNVAIDKKSAKAVFDALMERLRGLDSSKPAPVQTAAPSAADEILKYKQLLDAGVLTQEEFDAKKKQLLGL